MQAVVFDGALRFVPDYPTPAPSIGEALIRVTLAGICSTDQAIIQGYKGWQGVLGHEFTGVVEQVGSHADASWIGQRVVGEINVGCGECEDCRAGVQNHCASRGALGIFGRDGAFASYCTLPVKNLHVIPDHLPDEVAVFTEPLAAALEILEQVHIRPDTAAAVVGDGKLGCLVAQVLALTGADVALVGRHPDRAAMLNLREAAPEERFPLVVDCTGASDGFASARKRLTPRGKLMLKSTHLSAPPIDWSKLMVDEVSLIGSRCGPFAPALRLLASGRVNVRGLISAVYPLERVEEAFDAAGGRLKVLLRP